MLQFLNHFIHIARGDVSTLVRGEAVLGFLDPGGQNFWAVQTLDQLVGQQRPFISRQIQCLLLNFSHAHRMNLGGFGKNSSQAVVAGKTVLTVVQDCH
jgi:hypothetical protein